jgi:hypothetical protein
MDLTLVGKRAHSPRNKSVRRVPPGMRVAANAVPFDESNAFLNLLSKPVLRVAGCAQHLSFAVIHRSGLLEAMLACKRWSVRERSGTD